jgi:hypothetical protein
LEFNDGGALGTGPTNALGDNETGSATATVYRSSGEVVVLTYSARTLVANACLYYGQASAGPSTTG